MINTVNRYDFHHAFELYDRKDQFSNEGLNSLFDYLESYEEDTGEKIELDVIALCCEFTEYENLKEFNDNYSSHPDTCPHCGEGLPTESDMEETPGKCPDCGQCYFEFETIEDIENKTSVIMIDGDSFIIQDY